MNGNQNLNELMANASQAHQQGQLQIAENLYREIIKQFPQQPDVLHLLGVCCSQQGKHNEAIGFIQEAIRLNPHPMYFNNLGESLKRQESFEQAISSFKEAINLAPNFAEAYFNMANVFLIQGNNSEAEFNYQQTLKINPNHPRACFNLGNIMLGKNDFNQAASYYQKAIDLNPRFAEAHNNLGIALENRSTPDKKQAIYHYQQAIQLKADFLPPLLSLAKLLLEIADYNAAISAYENIARVSPNDPDIYNNLAFIFSKQEKWQEAVKCYQKAIGLKPDFSLAYRNLAKTLEKQGKISEAKQQYYKVLELEPNNVLLRLYTDTLDSPISMSSNEIEEYQKNLLLTIEQYKNIPLNTDMNSLHESGLRIPLSLVYQGREDGLIRKNYAELFEDVFSGEGRMQSAPANMDSFPRHTKPKIGFVVTENHEGIFTSSMKGILNNFPAGKFELTVICPEYNGKKIIQPSINNPAIKYLYLPGKFDQMVTAISKANFDLLYYWEIGTDATNYFLPFCRLAPVQCTSWGWQITSGIKQVDYYISSEPLETPESDNFYTEKLVRLKSLPTYYFKTPFPKVFKDRSSFGFRENQHIYLCPQNLRKIHPDFDRITSEILRRDPEAVYVVIDDHNSCITEMLKERFQETHKGFMDRIHFFPRMMSGPEYINLVKIADVMLDTLYYGGVNTSYDAFAVGTPIVTFPGKQHRARYTYAIYQKMGITDCLTSSEEEYIDLAVRIAGNTELRNNISNKILEKNPIIFEDKNSVTELADLFEKLLNDYRE
jgi:protein O-GlcNAc transferase